MVIEMSPRRSAQNVAKKNYNAQGILEGLFFIPLLTIYIKDLST